MIVHPILSHAFGGSLCLLWVFIRAKAQEASVRGGTSLTPCAGGVGRQASISRKEDAPLVLTLLSASAIVSELFII
jgi:hypothetical protein